MRHPIHCVIPPYIVERLARSRDPELRRRARASLVSGEQFRAAREAAVTLPLPRILRASPGEKRRMVYDAGSDFRLPGRLVRGEGDPPTGDPAVNEAYIHAGTTYDFYETVFDRRSLDGDGMALVSSVHVRDPDGEPLSNAFWNGEQMAYGDGDGRVFQRFTRALDVVGHELAHGVQTFTSRLVYRGESGALSEHFSDVFGVLVGQWRGDVPAREASWLVGADVLVPAPTRRAIRDMENPGTAFVNDPDLGTDPQPGHQKLLYVGPSDRGGVHINSGIPNRAFVLAAKALGGRAWETVGRVWYATMLRLPPTARFSDCARLTVEEALPFGERVERAVRDAWREVGLAVERPAARVACA
jgi:Zn-dependent metalloprotease